ncbi:hypothetical protein SPHINGO8AM_50084 [Sphingomonas sp. 8AM]|nr:hypothetical protein SPHINGO8AM_50084 [Sphingomonas sp. 8AM]
MGRVSADQPTVAPAEAGAYLCVVRVGGLTHASPGP